MYSLKDTVLRLFKIASQKKVFSIASSIVSLGDDIVLKLNHPEPETEYIFDLASLTKPLATGSICAKLFQEGKLNLDEPVGNALDIVINHPHITPRTLLSHCAGYPAWIPYYLIKKNKKISEIKSSIIKTELSYLPFQRSIYSDVGYLILGFFLEKITGRKFDTIYRENILKPLNIEYPDFLNNKKGGELQFAPTGYSPFRKRRLCGEVQDDNAFILMGVGGHSGLFGSSYDVWRIAFEWLRGYYGSSRFLERDVVRIFTKKHFPSISNWTLSWDTPTHPSSSGSFFSKKTIGHLGYTGTSIWIDIEREIIVILLTNRTIYNKKDTEIKKFRPLFHNEIMKNLCS